MTDIKLVSSIERDGDGREKVAGKCTSHNRILISLSALDLLSHPSKGLERVIMHEELHQFLLTSPREFKVRDMKELQEAHHLVIERMEKKMGIGPSLSNLFWMTVILFLIELLVIYFGFRM